MKKALLMKLKESVLSVMPVVLIVLGVSFTPIVNFEGKELAAFLVCVILLVAGMTFFNLGADIAMTPMGEYMGSGLSKTGSLKLVLIVCFFMGFCITVAEPDLSVLASLVKNVVNEAVLIGVVGFGVGLFLLIAILKIVFRKNLSLFLMLFYMLMFAGTAVLIESGRSDFIPLSFDAGGVTTGPVTVPFIMALGVGIALSVGGHDANENSFGLIALCSIGPMLSVVLLSLLNSGSPEHTEEAYAIALSAGEFAKILGQKALDVIRALGLIIVFFLTVNFAILKLPVKMLIRIGVGIVYTFGGLVLFLSAVDAGFMPVGHRLGVGLGNVGTRAVVAIGFVLGLVTVLAEPAVHVLNRQVEEITGGTVSKRSMLIALSVGVGISIALSMVRIIFGFSLLYYLVPGYFISLLLSLFVPGIYTAIAFDSGGVASGPLTSGFILPLSIGVCSVALGTESILTHAFGIVAMVAMTPLITIQILGFFAIATRRMRERAIINRILDADDEQIIYFDSGE